jgi:hypothetical protein
MRRREFIKVIAGSAAAWPFAAHTQQAGMPVIGFMSTRAPKSSLERLQDPQGKVPGLGQTFRQVFVGRDIQNPSCR